MKSRSHKLFNEVLYEDFLIFTILTTCACALFIQLKFCRRNARVIIHMREWINRLNELKIWKRDKFWIRNGILWFELKISVLSCVKRENIRLIRPYRLIHRHWHLQAVQAYCNRCTTEDRKERGRRGLKGKCCTWSRFHFDPAGAWGTLEGLVPSWLGGRMASEEVVSWIQYLNLSITREKKRRAKT
jgi:hypothetical protein